MKINFPITITAADTNKRTRMPRAMASCTVQRITKLRVDLRIRGGGG